MLIIEKTRDNIRIQSVTFDNVQIDFIIAKHAAYVYTLTIL